MKTSAANSNADRSLITVSEFTFTEDWTYTEIEFVTLTPTILETL